MLNNPGYAGWQEVEMTAEEQRDATAAASILSEAMERSGFAPETVASLQFAFGKAVSAGRDEPFNELQITLKDSGPESLKQPGEALEFMMYMQYMLKCAASLETPIFLDYTFSGSLVLASFGLVDNIRGVAKILEKERFFPPSGPAAP